MVTFSVVTLLALGLVASVLLAVASRVFHVEEDPRIAAVTEVLPGANCGGCGFAGCGGYAAAVVANPNVPPNKCCAAGLETHIAVGKLTGKNVAEVEPVYALRRCDKAGGHATVRYEYQGMPSCASAAMLRGGTLSCRYSCLGYGDCVQVCPFGAMHIGEDGMVHVNKNLCTGCGTCAQVCPRGILVLTPHRARVAVYCSNLDKGRPAMEVCEVSCLKCMRCVKMCPAKAVSYTDGLINIDHQKCLGYGASCGEVCVKACTRLILRLTRYADDKLPPRIDKWQLPAAPKAAPKKAAAPKQEKNGATEAQNAA